jgi:acyl-CoA-binding protein
VPDPDDFAAAQERVRKLSRAPTNVQLLELYALYKQATAGDATGSRPGLLDVRGRAKFDAWAGRRGMSAAEARQRYVSLVESLVRTIG